MECGEFADELRDQVIELIPVSNAVDERQVPLQQSGPVDAVQIAVVKVVTLQAPCFNEHLAPLFAGDDRENPAPQVHLRLAQVLRSIAGSIDNVDSLFLLDEHLLAVQ